MIFAGIDPSLTSTGVGLIDQDDYPFCWSIETKPEGPGWIPSRPLSRFFRYRHVSQEVQDLIRSADVVAIEGYAFGGSGDAVSKLYELGALLRWHLAMECGALIIEVPPTTLKKYATGNGRASKGDMLAAAREAYPQVAGELKRKKDNDRADALHLAGYARDFWKDYR